MLNDVSAPHRSRSEPVPSRKVRKALFLTCCAFAVWLLAGGALALLSPAASAQARQELETTPGEGRRARATYTLAVQAAAKDSEKVRKSLLTAGYRASLLSDAEIASPERLNSAAFDAVVFPDGALCPLAARDNLLRFLRQGGSMVVVGGPLFATSVAQTRQERERKMVDLAAPTRVVALEQAGAKAWTRSSSNLTAPTTWTLERTGPEPAPVALHVALTDLVLFWAKGGPRTTGMTVEIREKDGSRWIAAVPLTTRWRRVVLPPEAFVYWPDNPSKGRGGAGDQVRLPDAESLSIGIAQSHVNVPSGPHAYWITDIRAGRLPADLRAADYTLPTLELFSPFYKTYRLPSLHPTTAGLRAAAERGNVSGPIVTPIPRPRGLGFAGTRRGRWIPLAAITDETGRVAGTRMSLWVNLLPPYRGSVWAQIAAGDVVPAVRRMASGLFLAKAGAEQFSYFADEAVPLGCEVVNLRAAARAVEVRMAVRSADGAGQTLLRETGPFTLAGNASRTLTPEPLHLPARPQGYTITTELLVNGNVIDRIAQRISVLDSTPPPASAFVRVQDGRFLAPPLDQPNGPPRPWYPYGVNYWQSNVAGLDVQEYALHWLSPAYYDPDIVERDLTTLQSLGFTAVSIQLTDPVQIRQAN
ncbi:MAG TPA: hypothetical protein VKT32_11280, partial [Chthonomonadaceae bacterium]|nr:hypothetical protein [Chthonomonadaceae bacterium]